MNIARSATVSFLLLFAAFSPTSSTLPLSKPALAAPAGASSLTFRVTARVGATGQYAGPQQTLQARVFLRGKDARIETSAGGTPSVVLITAPYVYRLLPESKAGVRWKVKSTSSGGAQFDPQEMLRDPSKIRAALLRGGAKKTGAGVLDGTPVEIYEARNFQGKGQNAKVWLRRSDSLPLRLESRGGQLQVSASWRDYAHPKNLSASLFAVPKGFRVREVAGRPSFSAFGA